MYFMFQRRKLRLRNYDLGEEIIMHMHYGIILSFQEPQRTKYPTIPGADIIATSFPDSFAIIYPGT